ncbi:MAG TPA: isoprenyl transferase [Bacteroidales bacterium]|nr:isoprenyl transferase [Bacteroidales bacterium]
MSYKDKIDHNRIPIHVAIIMDGNGRWARRRGKERVFGHQHAVKAVRNTIEAAAESGVKFLTLYAFSTENWNRPDEEVSALMDLMVSALTNETASLIKNNIKLIVIGDGSRFSPQLRKKLDDAVESTSSCTLMTLIIALSYSSKWEISEACRKIARDVEAEKLKTEDIDETVFSSYLSTAGIPDPELMIRTSGEKRISNFLLWQLAYTELYFTEKLWPDFGKEDFLKAIFDFQKRERRFGLTSEQLEENN